MIRAREIMKSIAPQSHKIRLIPNDREFFKIEEENTTPQKNIVEESKVSKKAKWTKLFKRIRFFERYYHFLKIDILSNGEEAHLKWTGYVESQMRRLILTLGALEQIDDLRLYPKSFTRNDTMDVMNY